MIALVGRAVIVVVAAEFLKQSLMRQDTDIEHSCPYLGKYVGRYETDHIIARAGRTISIGNFRGL